MRVLGVDMGHKRIGLAVSDETGTIAFPAGILESKGKKRDLEALRAVIVEKAIDSAVVGLPIHLDGRKGPEADRVVRFAESLSKAAGIPVATLDERWTSLEAERQLREQRPKGKSGKKKRAERDAGRVDELAASIILRTYLERRANEAAEKGKEV